MDDLPARLSRRRASGPGPAVGRSERRGLPRARLHAVDSHHEQEPTRQLHVSVLSTSLITRTGLQELLAAFPDQITVLHDTEVDAHTDVTVQGDAIRTDVLVLDVAALHHPPHRYAVERALREGTPVVAIASGFNPDLPSYLRGTGVRTCVSPDIDAPELVATIESVARDPEGAPGSGGQHLRWGTEPGMEIFTPREYQVVARIVDGSSNQEIADAMFVSINSVKSYIRSAYRKMGVGTRSAAVLWLLREGIGYAVVDTDTDADADGPRTGRS